MATGGDVIASAPAPEKVVVLLKATGDAPILKQNKFKITAADKFEKVVGFLSAQLGRKGVFVYLNSAFTPSYDETVANPRTPGTASRGSSWSTTRFSRRGDDAGGGKGTRAAEQGRGARKEGRTMARARRTVLRMIW